MKTTLLLIASLLSVSAFGQKRTYTLAEMNAQIDTTTGAITYREVVQVDSATAKQLFDRGRLFIVKMFASEMSNQMADEVSGLIACRGKMPIPMSALQQTLLGMYRTAQYEMTVELRVKDGRYRYEISNLEIVNGLQRLRVDEETRKHPKQAKKAAKKEYSQREYDQYMGDKNPIAIFIKQMKAAMNPAKGKNDF